MNKNDMNSLLSEVRDFPL